MGTNYYLHEEQPCESCGAVPEPLHIGKSSAGWCFSLHVIPEKGINSLDDWKRRWKNPEPYIEDEYGDIVAVEEMEKIITDRHSERKYRSSEHYEDNYAMPGPNNLMRVSTDSNHCAGHGEGTWDYITGEFS